MKKSSVAAPIFAALLLLFSHTSAQPSEQDVVNSINQWISDVDNVNNFLNVAASLSDPTGAAANTKQTSLDEPVQLGILSSVPGLSDQANNAVLLLQEVFINVPNDLQSIVDDPSPSNVQTQLASINNVRCLNVLPALDILWPAAAAAVGAPAPPPANRPIACATISGR
jgi:hypothetical protein